MELKYEDLPIGWEICFLEECRQKDKCLRYKAATILPDDCYSANAVTPKVLKTKKCPCFKSIEIVRVAMGFSTIYREVKARHAPELRAYISQYLGGNGSYYRYLHGERMLMPEQQSWIRNLFKEYGYDENIEFDGYKDAYRFYDD